MLLKVIKQKKFDPYGDFLRVAIFQSKTEKNIQIHFREPSKKI
jgi:hypothetical protein